MMETLRRTNRADLKLNADLVHELLVRFIHDETTNAGFLKAVIGVSGGVDSAVSAVLAAEALGKENVLGVMMPYTTSSPQSVEDARLLMEKIGIRSELVGIDKMVDGYCAEQKITDPLRRGNVMARARMIVLYDISARERALVIGTSNKTEILVGYGTSTATLPRRSILSEISTNRKFGSLPKHLAFRNQSSTKLLRQISGKDKPTKKKWALRMRSRCTAVRNDRRTPFRFRACQRWL